MNYMRIMVLYKIHLGLLNYLSLIFILRGVLESWSFIIAYPITLY